jgi:hypothetical protein
LATSIVFIAIAILTGEDFHQLILPHSQVSGAYDATRFEGLAHLADELIRKL